MKRILFISTLLLLLAFIFVGCGDSNEPATTTPTVTTPTVTTPEPTVYYNITFMVDGEATVVRTAKGEIPIFTGSTDKASTVGADFVFTGWNVELAPATADALYVARYQTVPKQYPVHFSVNGSIVKTIEVAYGANAVYPDGSSYNGLNIAFWTNSENIKGETTCEAVCTSYDAETVKWAYAQDLIAYKNHYEGDGNVNGSSSAMLYLILAENDAPASGHIRDRALGHLRNLIAGGNEPGYNAGPFWSYAAVSMGIAVARHTPTIWNELTADEKDRLTLLMECYAILTCFVSDDDNEYKTGPALTGNFAKTWNPNHRMAMILPIVASTLFFSADGQNGADRVNAILTGFDHDSYIARCTDYGFTRIIYNWTTEGMTLSNGKVAPGAKELMMNGGDAYICHEDGGTTSNNIQLGTYVNGGVGVRTTYTYGGVGLDNLSAIVEKLYSYNYSGGKIISDSSKVSGGTNPVTGKPYAYIVDGTKSPFEGEDGLMLEFMGSDAGGIRSSTSYCTHDFILVVGSLAALEAMDAYSVDTASDLFHRMWAGNGDLIYKNEHGYNSYSIGNDRGQSSDASYPNYLPWKAWWQEHYANALKLTRPIQLILNGGTVDETIPPYELGKNDTVVSLPTPTHLVGTFKGWFLDASCKTTANDKLSIADGKLTIKAGYFEKIQLFAAFDIPDSVGRANIIVHIPSAFGLDGVYNALYYHLGSDVTFMLPTPTLPEGYSVVSWHRAQDFSDTPLTDTLVISADEVSLLKDIHLYARVQRIYYEQKENSLLDTPFSNKSANDPSHPDATFTLQQTLAPDGSVLLTKYAGEDGYFRVEGLSVKTGYLTIEATLYMDETLPMVGNGFRLRSKNANTPDSVLISSQGGITIGGTYVASLTQTPKKYSFVFHEQDDGVGYFIDFYIDGVYCATSAHDITSNSNGSEIDIQDISVLHWYFSKGNLGSMHISGLRVIDGFDVN